MAVVAKAQREIDDNDIPGQCSKDIDLLTDPVDKRSRNHQQQYGYPPAQLTVLVLTRVTPALNPPGERLDADINRVIGAQGAQLLNQ